jgi:hypothetical protein
MLASRVVQQSKLRWCEEFLYDLKRLPAGAETPDRRARLHCSASRVHGLTGQRTHFCRRHRSGSASRYARRSWEPCTQPRIGRFRWLVGIAHRPFSVEGRKKVRASPLRRAAFSMNFLAA